MDRKTQLLAFLKDSPDDSFLNYALAQEYISAENDTEAELIFNRILSIDPEYTATYYHLGKLLERKFEKEAAMDMYRKGIEISKRKGEQHTLSELQSALLELEYD